MASPSRSGTPVPVRAGTTDPGAPPQAATRGLRVCFFNRSYWPDTGATGQLLTELAEDLTARHGCAVTVVAGYPIRETGVMVRRETRNGVAIVRAFGTRLDPRRFIGRATNYVTYFISACLAAFRVPQADVVVALTDPPIIGLAAMLAARRSGAKFVFLCQDVFPEVATLLEGFQNPAINGVLGVVSRYLLRHADTIITLGDTMQRRLVAKGADPQKIAIIHNWADCRALRPRAKTNAFAREHGLADAFVVMHAGNIGQSQNLDMMLEAADRLRAYPDIRFVFVGDGSRRAQLAAAAAERGLAQVTFLPYQPRSEMGNSYAAADLFLISLQRGLSGFIVPSKLYTILAAGRPYVAAVEEDSEVVQIAREHHCGLVIPPGDADALSEGILQLYRDRQRTAEMGAHAREAGLRFDRRNQVAAYAALLARVARAPVTS